MFAFKKENKTKQNSPVNCFQVVETGNKACYWTSINDLPFGSADVSHEGRQQKNTPLQTQGSSDKGMSYVHSFGYFYLKLSKPLGLIRFYFKGNLHPIKFQRTELLIFPHLNSNESDFKKKKNFHNRDKVSWEGDCPILADSSWSSPPPHQWQHRQMPAQIN